MCASEDLARATCSSSALQEDQRANEVGGCVVDGWMDTGVFYAISYALLKYLIDL